MILPDFPETPRARGARPGVVKHQRPKTGMNGVSNSPNSSPNHGQSSLSRKKNVCIDACDIPNITASPRQTKTPRKAPFISNVKSNYVAKKDEALISSSEIAHLKKQIDSTKRKPIHWGDSSDQITYCPYDDPKEEDVVVEKKNESMIIHDNEKIDIKNEPHTVGLISQHASIMDFLGLPDSLPMMPLSK